MSLNCPEITVSGKQYITNVDNEQVEFTVYNNHLYVMTNENGNRLGATIMLESLPDVALYGQNGLSTADGVKFTLTLSEQDFSAWTTEDTNALIDVITQETGAQQVIITIEEGSVKISVEMVIGNNVDDITMNTFLEKVDTVEKLNTILAGSTHTKLQTSASQNNSLRTPTIVPVKVTLPQLISLSIDDTVTVDIIGRYEYFEWKSNGQWIRLPSPILPTNFGDLEGDHSIQFRFLNPQSMTLKEQTFNVTFPQKMPHIYASYSFDGDLNSSVGNYHLPTEWTGWNDSEYQFVAGRNGKQCLKMRGVSAGLNTLFADNFPKSSMSWSVWIKFLRQPQAGEGLFDWQHGTGGQKMHLGIFKWETDAEFYVYPGGGTIASADFYSADWKLHSMSAEHPGSPGVGGTIKYWIDGVKVVDVIPNNWKGTEILPPNHFWIGYGSSEPFFLMQDLTFYETSMTDAQAQSLSQ
tara:strand:+ start:1192 stop:2589 length:1398 start_codon:yes stop_codon:yes gene_type:complete